MLGFGPEVTLQKSRELLEAFELIEETSSTMDNDEIKKMAQRHTLDSSEGYLKTATEWAHALTDEAVTELLVWNDQKYLFAGANILLQWGPEAAPQKSRELLEAFKLIGETPVVLASPHIDSYVQRHILDSSEDYLKTATELADALTDEAVTELQARDEQKWFDSICAAVGSRAGPRKVS